MPNWWYSSSSTSTGTYSDGYNTWWFTIHYNPDGEEWVELHDEDSTPKKKLGFFND